VKPSKDQWIMKSDHCVLKRQASGIRVLHYQRQPYNEVYETPPVFLLFIEFSIK